MKRFIMASGLILGAVAAPTSSMAAPEKVVVPAPQIEESSPITLGKDSVTIHIFVDKTNKARCYVSRINTWNGISCLPIEK